MYRSLEQWLAEQGVIPELITVISLATGIFLVFIAALLVHAVTTRFLAPILEKIIRKRKDKAI